MVFALLLLLKSPMTCIGAYNPGPFHHHHLQRKKEEKKGKKKKKKGCNKNGVSSTDEQIINNPNPNTNWHKLHT
jgi:hypothetical protein